MDGSDRTWIGRAILHVDMDAFFAAIEQMDDPRLMGKPVIVGGDPSKRGVVATASYEARRFGVHSGMSSAEAARRCPGALWVRPRFERYREVARSVRELLASVTPLVEPVSIDEAYLDVTPGAHGDHPVMVARRIAERIGASGLSCSVGVASSKTVAKIASDRDKPHGLTVVYPGEEAGFLSPLPVGFLPGIGPAAQKRLAGFGVTTLGELASLDARTARALLGSFGPVAVERARGIDPREVVCERSVKSVSHEQTFPEDVTVEDARVHLVHLVQKVAARLRTRELSPRTLTVKVRFPDMATRSAQHTLACATDVEDEMLPAANELLGALARPGTRIRLLGFGASNLVEPAVQLELFDEDASTEERVRSRALAANVDAIRERFGPDAVKRGSEIVRRDRHEP